MAKPVHKQITSVLGFILLAVLVASFAFFGAGSVVTQQGAIVAQVGDQKVTATDFVQAFDNEIARYREQFGPEFDTQQALAIGLDDAVVNQLVQRAAMDQLAEDLGLMGSSEEVRSMIENTEAFKDLSGNFSEFTYKQLIQGSGQKVEDFENGVRMDIARTQLYSAVTETALLPTSLVDVLYTYRKESRRAKIATIPASSITNIEPASEEALLAYYEANPNMFASPEFRDLSFLIVRPEYFAENVELSDEDLQAEYDLRFEEFNVSENRTLEVAVFRDEAQARQLFERTGAGEDFAAVAAELTGFTVEELNLGDKSQFDVSGDYGNVAAERVFSVPLDGVTEPTQSLTAWQVFHVTSIIPASEKSFEASKDELRVIVSANLGIDNLYNAVAIIDSDVISGVGMEQLSVSSGIPIVRVEAVSNQGTNPVGALINEVQIFPMLSHAFSLEEDNLLELYEASEEEDVFYMIKVNSITPPAPPPFEEVKDRVAQAWVVEEQLRLAGSYANQALAEAEAGASLESIALKYGGISFETNSYRRDRVFTQRELAPAIAGLMFGLPEGGFGIEQDGRGDGYLIIQVTEIKSEDPNLDQVEFNALVSRLQIEMQNDLFMQLLTTLGSDYEISINMTLIENMYDPDFQSGAAPF